MKVILAFVLALSLGCAGYKIYDPNVLIDGEPALIEEGSYGGQGHISIETDDRGVRKVEVVQFGMSDVLGGTIKNIVGAAAGVFGGNPEPPEITINMPGQDLNTEKGNTDAPPD